MGCCQIAKSEDQGNTIEKETVINFKKVKGMAGKSPKNSKTYFRENLTGNEVNSMYGDKNYSDLSEIKEGRIFSLI